jgi:hypothetical protein
LEENQDGTTAAAPDTPQAAKPLPDANDTRTKAVQSLENTLLGANNAAPDAAPDAPPAADNGDELFKKQAIQRIRAAEADNAS